MTKTQEMRVGDSATPSDVKDLVRRVRRLDPAADETAIERYALEIAMADEMLVRLNLSQTADVAPFSPVWHTERQP